MYSQGYSVKAIFNNLAICAVLALCGGCGKTSNSTSSNEMPEQLLIEQAKRQVTAQLKDPDSAQFRNVRWETHAELVILCGEVNAKNGFGGYAGFRPFFAIQPGLLEKGRYDPTSPLVVHMNQNINCSH